ncbi:MAG: hypothetical protein ACK56I_05300, partial [bacterium]
MGRAIANRKILCGRLFDADIRFACDHNIFRQVAGDARRESIRPLTQNDAPLVNQALANGCIPQQALH